MSSKIPKYFYNEALKTPQLQVLTTRVQRPSADRLRAQQEYNNIKVYRKIFPFLTETDITVHKLFMSSSVQYKLLTTV